MALALAALMWPLMLLVRLAAGASLLAAALNILTLTLVMVACVILGVLYLSGSILTPRRLSCAGGRR